MLLGLPMDRCMDPFYSKRRIQSEQSAAHTLSTGGYLMNLKIALGCLAEEMRLEFY